MLAIASGIILAVIILCFAGEIIAFAFVAGGFLIAIAFIAVAFLIDPLIGWIVIFILLIGPVVNLLSSSDSSHGREKHNKDDDKKESEDPLSILPFYQRYPILISVIALHLQPAFTESRKIKKLVRKKEHVSKVTALVDERKRHIKDKEESRKIEAERFEKERIERRLNEEIDFLNNGIRKLERNVREYDFVLFSIMDGQWTIKLPNDAESELEYTVTASLSGSQRKTVLMIVKTIIQSENLQNEIVLSEEYIDPGSLVTVLKVDLRQEIANYLSDQTS